MGELLLAAAFRDVECRAKVAGVPWLAEARNADGAWGRTGSAPAAETTAER